MTDEDTTVVALLHDVVEDTNYTFDDLRAMGFKEQIIEALTLMTHDKTVPYLDYVRHLSENPIARAVKLADLKHNSDLTRLDIVTSKDEQRIQKYKEAMTILETC